MYMQPVKTTVKEFTYELSVEQDALMSPNLRGKLEDLAVGCVCVV